MGMVTASTGETYDAFTIKPPTVLPSKFMASKHAIRYQFPTQEDYIVYKVNGPSLSKVLTVPAASIVNDGYTDSALTWIFLRSESPGYLSLRSCQ